MKPNRDYKILECGSSTSLEIFVHRLLKEGWLPQGGPFIYNNYMCQAMIK